jgi:hypothetical protein
MNEGMRRLGAERGAVLSTVSPVMTITIVGATALALNKPSPPGPTMQTKAAPG